MKKLLSAFLVFVFLATMSVSVFAAEADEENLPNNYGELLGYDSPDAGYTFVDPEKANAVQPYATYTYLWDVYVDILGSGNMLSTWSNSKSISTSYTCLKVTGESNDKVTVGACYRNSQGSNVGLGSTTMSSKTVYCDISHKSGFTTNGYVKNGNPGQLSKKTYSFYGGK